MLGFTLLHPIIRSPSVDSLEPKMRTAFAQTLMELAARDTRILLLTGDLGFTVLEKFAKQFPNRFFNAGVAEANMIGLATGLASQGFIPYCYSIATFASMRAYEQIRNGPVLHQLPVRIVGIGGGFSYGHAGPTHFALEDYAIMRAQPAMTVIAPADPAQTRTIIRDTFNLPGPIYFRIGKGGDPEIPNLNGRFRLGGIEVIREGKNLAMIATGGIASEVVAAADLLAKDGIEGTVAIAATLNPPPSDELAALLSRFSLALTIEEHYTVGGLGSLVAEVVADNGLRCRVRRCGVERLPDTLGSQEWLRAKCGLLSKDIYDIARGC